MQRLERQAVQEIAFALLRTINATRPTNEHKLAVMIDDVRIEEWGALYPAAAVERLYRAKLHHAKDQVRYQFKDICQQLLASYAILVHCSGYQKHVSYSSFREIMILCKNGLLTLVFFIPSFLSIRSFNFLNTLLCDIRLGKRKPSTALRQTDLLALKSACRLVLDTNFYNTRALGVPNMSKVTRGIAMPFVHVLASLDLGTKRPAVAVFINSDGQLHALPTFTPAAAAHKTAFRDTMAGAWTY